MQLMDWQVLCSVFVGTVTRVLIDLISRVIFVGLNAYCVNLICFLYCRYDLSFVLLSFIQTRVCVSDRILVSSKIIYRREMRF